MGSKSGSPFTVMPYSTSVPITFEMAIYSPHERSLPPPSASATPGKQWDLFPDRAAKLIPAGSTMNFGLHYHPSNVEEVDVSRFSYPGPKPQSRESAIVMLADSCESATRAMQEPTPERVRDLIDTIVASKIADSQLDESPQGDLAPTAANFGTT